MGQGVSPWVQNTQQSPCSACISLLHSLQVCACRHLPTGITSFSLCPQEGQVSVDEGSIASIISEISDIGKKTSATDRLWRSMPRLQFPQVNAIVTSYPVRGSVWFASGRTTHKIWLVFLTDDSILYGTVDCHITIYSSRSYVDITII